MPNLLGQIINKLKRDPLLPSLITAAELGLTHIVEYHLSNDPSLINVPETRGRTPLIVAAEKGHKDVVALLLKAGARIGAKNDKNMTPLLFAAQEGHKDVVELLLNKGANIEDQDKYGMSPLIMAAQKGHKDVVELLLTKFGLNSEAHPREHKELQATSNVLQTWILAKENSSIDSDKEWLKRAKSIKTMIEKKCENLSPAQGIRDMTKSGLSVEPNHGGPVEAAASVKTLPKPLPNLSQRHLMAQIVKYLKQQQRDKEIIKKFENSPGFCNGFSSLWAYSKWLKKQPNPNNKIRDDESWLIGTMKTLAGWDGKRMPSREERNDFDRLIAHINFLQNPDEFDYATQQSSLEKNIQSTRIDDGGLNEEFSVVSSFNSTQLTAFLKTENVLHDGKLVYISSGGHAMSLFKDGKDYYFFDPNSKVGEVKYQRQELDKLADAIIAASFGKGNSIGLAFKMFSFDKSSPTQYPSPKKILEDAPPTSETPYQALLNLAIRTSCLESVRFFMEKILQQGGEKVLNVPYNDYTPLEMAASRRNLEIVKLFLESGKVDPNVKGKNGRTALWLAVTNGNEKIVKLFLESGKVDPNVKGKNGRTALWLAVTNGNEKIVKLFLESGKVDPNVLDNDGNTVLALAVKNGNEKIVEMLLAKGADKEAEDKQGITPLMIAAQTGHKDVVALLIKHGANIEAKQENGGTPLFFAVANGHHDVVALLIKHGANIEAKQENGGTPLFLR
jgi:ankyrin repeat protein